MSVGFFLGIIDSYVAEAYESAQVLIASINEILARRGIEPFHDRSPAPDAYDGPLFGRSALDHHSARCLAALAEFAQARQEASHLGLLATNPHRVAYLPQRFMPPFPTEYRELIWGEPVVIYAGSASVLLDEVLALAPSLGIPLTNNLLTDATAALINDFAPLYDGDSCELAEDERTAWLLLHEGARLAVEFDAALSLAG